MGLPQRSVLAVPLLLAAVVIAGCGSSSSSSHKSHKTSPAPYSSSSSSSSTSSTSSSGAVAVTTEHTALGTVLAAGPSHHTVYMFTGSSCTGSCAKIWPPVTGTPKAGAGVSAAKLSSAKTSSAANQIEYAGHPLFYFSYDKQAGQANGEGVKAFGGRWWVLSPAGTPVSKAAKKSSTTSSGYGGY